LTPAAANERAGKEIAMQTAEKINPCYPLFRDDDYKKNLAEKRVPV
jgi:hypothetical protein